MSVITAVSTHRLPNFLYIPWLATNLFSLGSVSFHKTFHRIMLSPILSSIHPLIIISSYPIIILSSYHLIILSSYRLIIYLSSFIFSLSSSSLTSYHSHTLNNRTLRFKLPIQHPLSLSSSRSEQILHILRSPSLLIPTLTCTCFPYPSNPKKLCD